MKHSYHTDIAIQYKLGMLDRSLITNIPSSTLHNWKNKDFSLFVGTEYVADYEKNLELIKKYISNKTLMNAAKAIYIVYCTYVDLFDLLKNKKKILRQSSELIINTIDRIKDTVGLTRAMRAFNISHQQYYAWKRKKQCKIYSHYLCRKIYHNQLSFKEIDTIRKYLSEPQYKHWSITSVYFQILRYKAAFFSKTTFYKYVNLLKLTRNRPEKIKYSTGLRANASKQILHMDVTIYRPFDRTKIYLYFLVDNFSRFILNWKASLKYSSNITFQNISEAYENYHLLKVNPILI